MIRVVTLVAPSTSLITTKASSSTSRICLNEAILSRLPNEKGSINFHQPAGPSSNNRSVSSTWRARIIVGPEALANEIDDVNRFLTAKACGIGKYKMVDPSTIQKLAVNLRHYLEWLSSHWYPADHNNHYLNFRSAQELRRPTYAYRKFLLNLSEIASSTKNDRIAAVRSFYQDLERRGVLDNTGIENYHKEKTSFLHTHSTTGVSIRQRIKTSDLKIPHGSSSAIATLESRVMDDGMVRPLSDPELKVVVKVLQDLDNPVLRLTAFLALNCGARLQTVLTLRRMHAHEMAKCFADGASHVAIPVGKPELAQAKGNSAYTIQVPTHPDAMIVPYEDAANRPRSVGELIGDFEASEFALSRFERARSQRQKHSAELSDHNHEYLFLGRNGMPYYLHSNDPLNAARKSERRGGAFKGSLKDTLVPRVRRAAEESDCRDLAKAGLGFHDFRGTFAEQNLLATIAVCLEKGIERARAEEIALRQTQRLLGHRHIESTYRYLHFRDEGARLLEANEKYVESLVGSPR